MGLFSKKEDPLSERSRTLKGEIATLEAKIKKLSAQVGQTSNFSSGTATGLATPIPAAPVAAEPIFEETPNTRLKVESETLASAEHYNELGFRKFDLPGFIRRVQN